jgi:hypothetical protein
MARAQIVKILPHTSKLLPDTTDSEYVRGESRRTAGPVAQGARLCFLPSNSPSPTLLDPGKQASCLFRHKGTPSPPIYDRSNNINVRSLSELSNEAESQTQGHQEQQGGHGELDKAHGYLGEQAPPEKGAQKGCNHGGQKRAGVFAQ